MTETVLDRIRNRIAEALMYDGNVRVAPGALLWPDEGAQWQAVVDRLQEHLGVVSLGDYDSNSKSGPAYWIRCVVARTISLDLPDGPPIVYLPGVARNDLRAIDNCPPHLAPIAELQYRSQWFSHANGKDWSVRSFLTHAERGLGLHIADDKETTETLLLALPLLMDEPFDRLQKQVLDADFFRDLVNPDPVRSLLGWLDDPHVYRGRLDDKQWTALVHQCKADFGFDPMQEGEVTAARLLGEQKGAWASVWKRFSETPDLYPGIPKQLRKAGAEQMMLGGGQASEAWPQDNEAAEDQLRNRLLDFQVLTPEGARGEIARIDKDHAWRRRTVWASLNAAPLAFAVEQLVVLGELTAKPLEISGLEPLIDDYATRGWRADDAVVSALAAVSTTYDREAVSAAAAAMYRPWLHEAAKALQAIIGPMANSDTYKAEAPASAEKGTVALFVDGLRMDIGRRLEERLTGAGFEVELSSALSPLPTVTQTAKPAVTPIPEGALMGGPDLHTANASTGTKASIQMLRNLMADSGIQILGPVEVGDTSGTAWTEVGEIDHRGHDVGLRLVEDVDGEVDTILRRIRELVEGGWERVQVVTDHGWILLPGGMEKVELPSTTALIKKGRCARLKEGAVVEAPTVPWHWDGQVRIALAPGVSCFEANKEYEHGGVSPQECIVPRLLVRAKTKQAATGGPEITKVKWLGFLCRIELSGFGQGVVADLRALPADANTSIAEEAKETAGAGRVSLVVPDEEHEGERAHVVLVARTGEILVQREVIVGRNR